MADELSQESLDERKTKIEGAVSKLKGETDTLRKKNAESPMEGRSKAIEALQLITSGIEMNVKVTEDAETKDETHCECGMAIRLADLGDSSGSLYTDATNLMLDWALYQKDCKTFEKSSGATE